MDVGCFHGSVPGPPTNPAMSHKSSLSSTQSATTVGSRAHAARLQLGAVSRCVTSGAVRMRRGVVQVCDSPTWFSSHCQFAHDERPALRRCGRGNIRYRRCRPTNGHMRQGACGLDFCLFKMLSSISQGAFVRACVGGAGWMDYGRAVARPYPRAS